MKTPLFVSLLFLLSPLAQAAELGGVTLPDTVKLGDKILQLNGLGVREATIFKVKVYVAGLYVEAPSRDGNAILDSSAPKQMVLHFVHDVSADKMRDAWKEGIEKNCKTGCEKLQEPLRRLNALMQDLKTGDVMTFSFLADRVEMRIQGGPTEKIEGAGFSQILLAIWLGASPPNKGLKEGLLGAGKG